VSTSGAEATQAVIADENDAVLARINLRRVLMHPAASTSGEIYCGGGEADVETVPGAAGPTREGR
jgi:hypothetical protein